MQFRHDVRPYYARLAETMLRSWIGGDIVKLRRELDSTANSWWWPKNQIDRYRLELLRVVARGMRNCPDLYEQRATNPMIGTYLDILEALSTTSSQRGDSADRLTLVKSK